MALKYLQFEKVKDIEKQINELKKTRYEDFTRPVSAFITFESAAGQFKALKFKPVNIRASKEPRGTFLESPLIMIQATEPTNIIWENRQLTKT